MFWGANKYFCCGFMLSETCIAVLLLQDRLYKLLVNRRRESYLSLYGQLDCDGRTKYRSISEFVFGPAG